MKNSKTTDITFYSIAMYDADDNEAVLMKAKLSTPLIETKKGLPLFYDKFSAGQVSSQLLPQAMAEDKMVSLVTITENYDRVWKDGRNFNSYVETLLPEEVADNEFINLGQISFELRENIIDIITKSLKNSTTPAIGDVFSKCSTTGEFYDALSEYPFVIDLLKEDDTFSHVKAFQLPYKGIEADSRRIVVYEFKDPKIECFMDSNINIVLPKEYEHLLNQTTDNNPINKL